MSIKSVTPTTQPVQPIRSYYLTTLQAALPWLAFVAAFVFVNHAADTQTLATAAAAGGPAATDAAQSLWLIPLAACVAGLLTAIVPGLRSRLIAAVAAVLSISLLALPGPQFLLPLVLVPVAIIGAHAFFSLKNSLPWRSGAFAASLLTLIIAYAAHGRQEVFFRMVNMTPDPDFGSYLTYAGTTTGWATLFREPFYIWVLQVADKLGGDLNPVMVRLTSVATGLAAVAAIFQLCRKHLNLTVAVIAATLYAGQKYMVYTSARGLREDTIVCTAMLFISVGWSHLRGPATWKSLSLWGLIGAACSLLRISSFSFALVTIAATGLYRFIRDIKPWRQRALWLIPILIPIALMIPYFMHLNRTYNDPYFVLNYAARYYANEEFGGIRPDFPTRAELAVDAYTGPKITPSEYIFNYHSTGEIVERTWDGFVKTFFGSIFKIAFSSEWTMKMLGLIYVLHFAGICLLLFPNRIYLILTMLLFHGPTFFLASAASFDPRLLILGMVFGYITVASAIGLGIGYGWRYLHHSDDERTPQVQLRQRRMKPHKHKNAR